MPAFLTRVAFPLAMMALVAGCAARTTIQELKYNPGRYQNRTVSIDGTVTEAWGVPLVPFRLYKVEDGTGEVTILARQGRTPSKGARVRVTGHVKDVGTFDGTTLGLHIQETDLDFKR
jgi:hypothetical protein